MGSLAEGLIGKLQNKHVEVVGDYEVVFDISPIPSRHSNTLAEPRALCQDSVVYSKDISEMWTLFRYEYRDADNYKLQGCIALRGQIDSDGTRQVEAALESGEFFIAEQVGVPPLQPQLQTQFGGRNESDHCWHRFDGWYVVDHLATGVSEHGEIGWFVDRFAQMERWQEDLSPEFGSI